MGLSSFSISSVHPTTETKASEIRFYSKNLNSQSNQIKLFDFFFQVNSNKYFELIELKFVIRIID